MRRFWNKGQTRNKKAESEASSPEELLGACAEQIPLEEQSKVIVDTGWEAEDRQRYEEIFRTFWSALMAFVVRRGIRPAIAEEMIQDVFLHLSRHWERYNQECKTEDDIRRLLFRMAVNRITDHWRAGKDPGDATVKGDEEQKLPERSGATDTHSLQEAAVLLKQMIALGKKELGATNFDILQKSLLGFDSIDIQQKLNLKSDNQVRTRLSRMQGQIAELRRKAEGIREQRRSKIT